MKCIFFLNCCNKQNFLLSCKLLLKKISIKLKPKSGCKCDIYVNDKIIYDILRTYFITFIKPNLDHFKYFVVSYFVVLFIKNNISLSFW